MRRLEISLLGEFRVRFDDAPWRFVAPPKCTILLALLLLADEPLGRPTLAATLWPDEDDAAARANLRRHLHALTNALPKIDGVAWLETSTSTVAWNHAAPARSDLREFLTLASATPTRATATRLYRGALLAGTFDEAILGPRERLSALHLDLLTALALEARAARDYPSAIDYAEEILAIDEWREDALRLLMSARAFSGDRSGALAAYERFARRLHDELATQPAFDTIAIRDAILNETLPQDDDALLEAVVQPHALIGRDAAFKTLHALWTRASRGAGTTVFVSGEPGIGKTRLTQELVAAAAAQNGRAIVGRTSMPESIPYQPIVEALRHTIPFMRVGERDNRWLSALLPLLPEVSRLQQAPAEHPALEPSRARLRLHDAFRRAFAASAAVRPLVVLLEDLHFAQTDTIDAVGAVAEAISSIPVLLVITYRSTEASPDSSIRALRRRLARASLAHHLPLGRLGPEEIRHIAASAGSDVDDAFAERVYALSEGNPLFAWQLIHDRIERGDRASPDVRTVGDAIARRLEHVDAQTRAVAEVAATIGDTFTVEEIAEVGGWEEASVVASLADLLDRQLVGERSGAAFEYGFTHALIRGAIYDESPLEARAMRHRRAASVLAQTRTEHGGVLPLIAQHWLQAGETFRARGTLLLAARAALESYARHDARESALQALRLHPSPQERLDLLSIVVRATDKRANLDETENVLEEFETLAASLGRPAQFDALLTRITFHNDHAQRLAQTEAAERLAAFVRPDDPAAWRIESILQNVIVKMQRGMTAEGEAQLGPLDRSTIADQRQLQLCLSTLAQSLVRQGKYEAGDAILAEFRTYLDEHPNLDGEWLYTYSLHKKTWLTEDSPTIARTATRLIEIAQRRGDVTDEAAGLMDLAAVKHNLHDTAGSRRDYHRAMELWGRAGQWQGWANTAVNLGEAECEIGHFDRAIELWEAGKQRGRETGARFSPIIADINLADLELLRGDGPAALARLEPLVALLADTGETRTIAELDIVLGRALCACGRVDDGLPRMQRGIELLRPMVQGRWRASQLAHYIEAMIAHARTAELESATRELEALFDEDPHDHVSPARICLALAASARVAGDPRRAEGFLERGRDAVLARLEALTEEDDRLAYLALAANRNILGSALPSMSHST